MKTKINEAIKQVLQQFGEKYFIGEILNKNKVIQDLDTYDKDLLEAFISNETIQSNFTIDIVGNIVMQTNKLIELFEADEYWQDSYTKYSKKIGLTADGKFIDESTDVVLDFPYKDTVLKASMSKEDTDKDDLRPEEPFLNEVLAKEEIDVLLDKKILVNAKKFDVDGVHEIESFSEDDNLIIKGNNLLALHTLKEKFSGKIKLIYIDPPYNTGNDGFDYNDKFNHSTWLTFMKNRLEIACELLCEEGTIWVQTDDVETNYLGVLLDQVFDRNNFINIVTVKTKISGVSGSSEGKSLRDATEFIQVYAKNKEKVYLNPVFEVTPVVEYVNEYKESGKSWKYTQVLEELGDRILIDNNGERAYYHYPNAKITSIKQFAKSNNLTEEGVYNQFPEKIFRTTNAQSSVRGRVITDLKDIDSGIVSIEYKPIKGKSANELIEIFYNGSNKDMFMFLSDRLVEVKGKLMYQQKLSTLWEDIQYNNLKKEGQVDFPNGKKPEKLLKNIIELASDEGDIVLDFFMGSGSTQAAALKLGRKFIGMEQIDTQWNKAVERLKKAVNNDQSGISKEVDWQGGGSFVYLELMEKNRGFLKTIQDTKTQAELHDVFDFMLNEAEIDFRVDLEKIKDTLHELSFDDQKKTLIKIIDKNQLYYNYSEIDDENVRDLISDNDYEFNKNFYDKGGE
ncbi:type III restriction endonuclease subunit M [Staphylococcus sp. HMSC074B09]|nr:type III restriction endonuclease subunit M [Staphylococcus sp. HMSC074B09]